MQRKFLSNLILVILLNVLVKPFYIVGIDAEFLKRIESNSPGDYGMYFSLLGLTFMFNIFLDMGINNYNTRLVARNENWIVKQFSTMLSIRILLVLVYFLLLFFAGISLGYSSDYYFLLGILGLNQVLVAFILFIRSNLSGLLLFKQDSIVSVLDRTVLVIICSIILWGNVYKQPLTVELFAWLQTAAYLFTLIIASMLFAFKAPKIKFTFDINLAKSIVKKSAPYALLILLMMVYYRMDSVMVERMLPDGARQSALYAQGFRFFEAFTMIGYLFAGLLLPIFSSLLTKKQSVNPITTFSMKLLFSGAMIICCVMWYHKFELMSWRYDVVENELLHSSLSFGILMISFVGMSLTYVYGTLLTANGSLNYLNWMALGGVLLNFVLNYFLIPKYGIIGASWASMVTQLLTAFLQIIIAHKLLNLTLRKKDGLALLLFSAALIFLMILVPQNVIPNLMLSLIVFTSMGLLIAFATRMIDVRSMLSILKSKVEI
jgi:O-antigen/teichoic acid export membrane protein